MGMEISAGAFICSFFAAKETSTSYYTIGIAKREPGATDAESVIVASPYRPYLLPEYEHNQDTRRSTSTVESGRHHLLEPAPLVPS